MNDPYEPFDELHFDGEQISRPIVFSEMEQRLRQLQPRPPQIDLLAIEQEACCMVTPVSSTIIQGVEKVSSTRFVGTIASSWMCGAVVGAACVFFFLSNQKQPMLDRDQLAEIPSPIQNVVEADSVESQTNTASGQMDLRSGTFGVDSTLRWRGRYVKTSELFSQPESIRDIGSNEVVTTASTTDTGSFSNLLLSQFSPPQPVTQAELMRELLNPSKNTVH